MTKHEDELCEALVRAVREYLHEHDNPVADYSHRYNMRERMRKTLARFPDSFGKMKS